MDVILHAGAHRTGSSSFQRYLNGQTEGFARQGITVWTPRRTRDGVLFGLAETPGGHPKAQRAVGRVRLNLATEAQAGTRLLFVSDENMTGTPRACLRSGMLYPAIGERMARISAGFGGVRRICLQVRALDVWWGSMLAYLLARGVPLPRPDTLAALACAGRSWRDVITDLACACPGAEIRVTLFDDFAARPDRFWTAVTGLDAPPLPRGGAPWVNRSPGLQQLRALLEERGEDATRLPDDIGRWHPFSASQAARLREEFADDVFWLRAGADGLATVTESDASAGLAKTLAATAQDKKRGHHDRPDPKSRLPRRVALPRGERTARPPAG